MDEEIATISMACPHVLLLGAGASKAALPNGDKNGRSVPVMRDIADELNLTQLFPGDLKELAGTDFESAYSRMFERHDAGLDELDRRIARYFKRLELPDGPNPYDYLHLCLRDKDAIFTFNWDPFLVQSRIRLAALGVSKFPKLFFLHGNVRIGFCVRDATSGIAGRPCSQCREPFVPSNLLFPVEKKNYQADPLIVREWAAARYFLKNCFMFTVFGYSAPKTDLDAISLLKGAWGDVQKRQMEQTEIINRPGSDHEALRETWDPFIHTHHYEIHDSFFESWLAMHPRRSGEAYRNQYIEARFIADNAVPQGVTELEELVAWFRPLLDVEFAQESTSSAES